MKTENRANKKHKDASNVQDQQILTTAVLAAAERLECPPKLLGRILGVSESTISRMNNSQYQLKEDRKEHECGLAFVRLYRGIDAITGGDDRSNKSWLTTYNTVLQGVPCELIETITGLIYAVQYVDSYRAKI